MWPFRETPTPVDKKKKKVREGLTKKKKPFAGSMGAGIAAKRRHKRQLEEALRYE